MHGRRAVQFRTRWAFLAILPFWMANRQIDASMTGQFGPLRAGEVLKLGEYRLVCAAARAGKDWQPSSLGQIIQMLAIDD